jgi:outer membrane protein OmpA-like peptidoglycan-associated protein
MATQYDEVESGERYPLIDELLAEADELSDEAAGYADEFEAPAPPPGRGGEASVRWVQQALNRVLGLRLAVDGIAGPQTRSAIRSYQQQRGLAVDGVAGPQTLARLAADTGQAPPTPGRGHTAGPTRTVAPCADCPAGAACAVLDHFAFDRDTPESRHAARHADQIRAIAARIVQSHRTSRPIQVVRLIGHTDRVGTDQYNIGLAMRRATAVMRKLQDELKPAGLTRQVGFVPISRGESQQVSPQNQALNRRVEVCLIPVARAGRASSTTS